MDSMQTIPDFGYDMIELGDEQKRDAWELLWAFV